MTFFFIEALENAKSNHSDAFSIKAKIICSKTNLVGVYT